MSAALRTLVLRGCALISGLAMFSACYSPTLRDCTVTCEGPGDCAGGQICGSDHFCAAPEVADHCAQRVGPDGDSPPMDAVLGDGADVDDARLPVDARADAATATVILHLRDDGNGAIAIAGGATCATSGPQHGDCMIAVAAGVVVTLHATGEHSAVFQSWSGQACSGTNPTCSLVPNLATTDIHAKFHNP